MRNIKNVVLTLVLIIFIINSNIIIKSTIDASYIFFNKVFVTIFPFIILSEILIYYNYHIFINNLLGKILSKLFNISKNSTIVFILSILSSHPSNAIYIKGLYDKKIINENEAKRVLNFTYFPSIMFVIGMIGINLYNSFKIGLGLLLVNYLNNILIGIFTKEKIIEEKIEVIDIKENIMTVIKNAIQKGINTSFIILGNITIFTIITNILNKYLNTNIILNSVISGLLELTSGIIKISTLNIQLNIKLFLTSFILNFSGLAILFQSMSIMSPIKTNIKKIIIIKLLFSLLTSIIFLICF